jgi:hypothetical protein
MYFWAKVRQTLLYICSIFLFISNGNTMSERWRGREWEEWVSSALIGNSGRIFAK